MDGNTLLVIVFFVIGIGTIIFISKSMNKKTDREENSQQQQQQQQQEAELTERFHVGKYLDGLPDFNGPAPLVYCGVTEESFVLRKGTQGAEIGRIPRGSVSSVDISKKDKQHCITINWAAAGGTKYNSLFELADKDSQKSATQAAENIKKWT